jgi:hypothetical protein
MNLSNRITKYFQVTFGGRKDLDCWPVCQRWFSGCLRDVDCVGHGRYRSRCRLLYRHGSIIVIRVRLRLFVRRLKIVPAPKNLFLTEILPIPSAPFEESLSQLTHRKLFASSFRCGESPRRHRACQRMIYGKQPSLGTAVPFVDGENDLRRPLLALSPSLPLCRLSRRLAPGEGRGFAKIRAFPLLGCSA